MAVSAFFVIFMVTIKNKIVSSMDAARHLMKEWYHGLKLDFCLRSLQKMKKYLSTNFVSSLKIAPSSAQPESAFGMKWKWQIHLPGKFLCTVNASLTKKERRESHNNSYPRTSVKLRKVSCFQSVSTLSSNPNLSSGSNLIDSKKSLASQPGLKLRKRPKCN